MATHFKWTQNLSVGNKDIDSQHQRLLLQINKVVDAVTFGATSKEVTEALDFFERYSKEHFSYEEKYMEKYNYPDLEDHKKRHNDFVKNYSSFKEKFKNGADPRELALDIEMYLGQWLIKHVGKEDKKYHIFVDALAQKA